MDSLGKGIRARRTGRTGRGPGAGRVAVALFALFGFIAAAKAADIPPELRRAAEAVKPFAKQVGYDARDIFPAPATRWRTHEWTRFGEGAAIVLAAYAADNQIVKFVSRQQNPALNRYLSGVTHFGGGYGQDVAALLALGGLATGDERMMDAGLDALEASVFASGIVTPGIKRAVGRARPIQGHGKNFFDGFETAYESFPSGHSTNAFAIYSAIAARYSDNRYVPAIAYTIATSVAIARVHDRVHFASDVLAGGMIGHAIAKSIVANHKRMHVALVPTGHGMLADIRF